MSGFSFSCSALLFSLFWPIFNEPSLLNLVLCLCFRESLCAYYLLSRILATPPMGVNGSLSDLCTILKSGQRMLSCWSLVSTITPGSKSLDLMDLSSENHTFSTILISLTGSYNVSSNHVMQVLDFKVLSECSGKINSLEICREF